MLSTDRVKIAVVGCGKISAVYLKNLKELLSVTEVVAVCDVNEAAAEEKARRYGVEKVMTLDEIAMSGEIELVVVLTGPAYNFSVIEKMLSAGKHVYTEKTLAQSVDKARELVGLAREKGVLLAAAPDTILGAGVQTARKLIDSGMIGAPTSFLASINRNHGLNSETFKFIQASESAAFAYDVGIYYVAAMLCLMGPASNVSGVTTASPAHKAEHLADYSASDEWTLPGANLLSGSLLFKSGAVGSLHFNGNSINSQQDMLYVFGTEGIVRLEGCMGFGGKVTLIRAESGECVIPHTHGYDGGSVIGELDATDEAPYGHRGIGVAELAWAIRGGRECRCSGAFALHTLEVLHGIEEASRSGIAQNIASAFDCKALPSGYMSTMFGGWARGDAERSLI